MKTFCKIPLIISALSLTAIFANGESAWRAKLRSSDLSVRRAAIDEIQTLDDSRIPEACLPLLSQPGFSIRRQAARAIGSRFDQIPKSEIPRYLQALHQCAKTSPEDVGMICNRAIGLLTRQYRHNPNFSISPDGKWVLYEQRRLPAILNVATQAHELLTPKVTFKDADLYPFFASFVKDGDIMEDFKRHTPLLKLMRTNSSVDDLFGVLDGQKAKTSPHLEPKVSWQPQSLAVAFSPAIQLRFVQPICIWRARDNHLTVWDFDALQPACRDKFQSRHWSSTVDFVKWDGTRAILHVYDCDDGGGQPYDPVGVKLAVDINTGKISRVEPR